MGGNARGLLQGPTTRAPRPGERCRTRGAHESAAHPRRHVAVGRAPQGPSRRARGPARWGAARELHRAAYACARHRLVQRVRVRVRHSPAVDAQLRTAARDRADRRERTAAPRRGGADADSPCPCRRRGDGDGAWARGPRLRAIEPVRLLERRLRHSPGARSLPPRRRPRAGRRRADGERATPASLWVCGDRRRGGRRRGPVPARRALAASKGSAAPTARGLSCWSCARSTAGRRRPRRRASRGAGPASARGR